MRIKDIKIGRFALTERMWGKWSRFNGRLRDAFKRRGVHHAPRTMTVGVVKDFTTGYHFARTERAIFKISNPLPITHANTSETGCLLMHVCLASLRTGSQSQ